VASEFRRKNLVHFEVVVNVVHKAAPGMLIAFNTRPEDTADAAARELLTRDSPKIC
jgi:hypothetical protein